VFAICYIAIGDSFLVRNNTASYWFRFFQESRENVSKYLTRNEIIYPEFVWKHLNNCRLLCIIFNPVVTSKKLGESSIEVNVGSNFASLEKYCSSIGGRGSIVTTYIYTTYHFIVSLIRFSYLVISA